MAMLLLPVRGAVFLLTVFVAVPGGGPPTAGALLALWAVVYCFSRGECPERPGAMGCDTPLPVSSCPLRDTARRVRQPMAPDESARILARARRSTCSMGNRNSRRRCTGSTGSKFYHMKTRITSIAE